MEGPLLSRENAPLEVSGVPSNADPQEEFHRLESFLQTDGTDKLVDAYFDFLSFCTKHNRQLRHLLTTSVLKPHCVRLFKVFRSNKERFQNDVRFVQCIMWFGQFQPRVYKDAMEKGIGTKCAVTYVMFARQLAKQGDTSEAVAVIRKGLENEALPISYLEDTLRELHGGNASTVLLNTRGNEPMVNSQNVPQIILHVDPHSRYMAEPRDFASDQYRSYDFRAVYPECNPEEFQFEEKRFQRYLEKRKIDDERKATQNVVNEKNEIIQSLRETIVRLQHEKELLQMDNGNRITKNIPLSDRKNRPISCTSELTPKPPLLPVPSAGSYRSLFDDTHTTDISVPLTSTQKPLSTQPQQETSSKPLLLVEEDKSPLATKEQRPTQDYCSGPSESTATMNNRTEMMTRDMRELFWNGTLNSTGVLQSAEVTPAKTMDEVKDDLSDAVENINSIDAGEQQQKRLTVFEENMASHPVAPVSMTKGQSDENDGIKRKATDINRSAKRFAICTDENEPGSSNRDGGGQQPLKLKIFDENPDPFVSEKDTEDKENVAPRGYQQPARNSRRLNGILVDADGFETGPAPHSSEESPELSPDSSNGPVDDEDLGVAPLEESVEPPGRFKASTPTKNTPNNQEVTWRVTEVLRQNMLPPMAVHDKDIESYPSPGENLLRGTPMHTNERRLSTILEASKESGSSGSSNSLGTPSLAPSVSSQCEHSEAESQLNPILSDPFNPAHRNKVILGSKICYETITGNLPQMKKKSRIQYPGGYAATILKLIGEGGFAKVYFAQREVDDEEEDFSDGRESTTCIVRDDQAAVKITKEISSGLWEYYILNTVSSRLQRLGGVPCIRKSIPEPHCAAYYQNGFLISLPYLPYGSLVDLVNTYEKSMPEELVRYFILELMIIVMRLHETGIIHGDLKPDNVLFRKIPTMHMVGELRRKTQCICLIDFGQAIDTRTFPIGTTFSYVTQRESLRCVAMRESRDWLFDVDWFGVANCAHTLLFGEYIDIEKRPSGDYGIKRRIPRYWANEWWDEVFSTLLNITAMNSQPGHVDNPIKRIIELGGETLCDRKTTTSLSLRLIRLNTLMADRKVHL